MSSDQENTVMDIIKQISNELKSPLSIFKKDFHIKEESSHYFTFSGFAKEFKIRKPKLTGNFQINNVALAIAAILNSRVKYNISEIKVSNAIHGANSLGRLQEIDNKLIPPYKKVIFGSIKYAHSSVDIVKTEADYSIKIHDEALMFFNVLNYMKANETKIGTLAVSVNKNSKVLEKMLENLKINKNQKKYFSSKIKYLQKNIKKETLLILETTVQADREYYQNLAILKQIKQPHFELNFKFAKKK